MPEEIVMPRLSDTMTEGTVAKWLKREGEPVRKGEPLLEVETDKATMELPAYRDGVLTKILVREGITVPLGTPIALLATPEEGQATGAGAAPRAAGPPVAEARAQPAAPAPAESVPEAEPLRATPVARRVAEEHGLDLTALAGKGSGPGGRIVLADVERYLAERAQAAPPPPPAPAAAAPDIELRAVSRIHQVMAQRTAQSAREIPHYYLTIEIDMAAALDLRRQLAALAPAEGKVSINDLVLRATALALRAVPEVNSTWRDGQLAIHRRVHLGLAVAVPDGLVVPVIRDADQKTLLQIAAEAHLLAAKARAGTLRLEEIQGSTFTVSNLGMFEVEEFRGLINPPEAGLLAVGAVVEKPVALSGQIALRPRMRVTLAADHRAYSGDVGSRFLQTLKRLLEEPLRLAF
jgi:pyruvate dehydrogenase E2 component (dihydrolipoamide acetyltransferase)